MPRIQLASAGVVVVGQVFAPSLLSPDLFRKFFGNEAPRGIGTNMISQLEYTQSKYVITLQENNFQVVKREPRTTQLDQLREVVSSFLKRNPLVRITAVGLNFEGFVGYSSAGGGRRRAQDGEAQFLGKFAVIDVFNKLTGSRIEKGSFQVTYEEKGARCRLALRSDSLLDNNKGVDLSLNVHRDVDTRRESTSHISDLKRWFAYFSSLEKRLAGLI